MNQNMIATKALTYAGRNLKAGDPFDATEKDAMILTGLGSARKAKTSIETREVKAADDEEQSERGKRKYRRRDMQAEG